MKQNKNNKKAATTKVAAFRKKLKNTVERSSHNKIVNEVNQRQSIEILTPKKGAPNAMDYIFTGEKLLNMNVTELPYLIKPIFQQTGVVALAGSSDTGKSSFLRQLVCSIVLRMKYFLGFEINARFYNAIYVSSEDDASAMAYLLKKQKRPDKSNAQYKNLRYIFDTDDLINKLEEALIHQPADCIIIDTFTDMYGGELNASNKVRHYLNQYSVIAARYNCLIIFLHHTGKRTEENIPSKDNLLGSQGFEAKMRLVIELRKDYSNPKNRHLCIVKGNYIPTAEKEMSYVLKFDENMLFTNTQNRVPITNLARPNYKNSAAGKAKEVAMARAIELKKDGKSLRDIETILNKDGYEIGKSTIGNWTQDCPTVQPPSGNVDDGQEIKNNNLKNEEDGQN